MAHYLNQLYIIIMIAIILILIILFIYYVIVLPFKNHKVSDTFTNLNSA